MCHKDQFPRSVGSGQGDNQFRDLCHPVIPSAILSDGIVNAIHSRLGTARSGVLSPAAALSLQIADRSTEPSVRVRLRTQGMSGMECDKVVDVRTYAVDAHLRERAAYGRVCGCTVGLACLAACSHYYCQCKGNKSFHHNGKSSQSSTANITKKQGTPKSLLRESHSSGSN